jgi:hypothetical protein
MLPDRDAIDPTSGWIDAFEIYFPQPAQSSCSIGMKVST